MASLFDVKNLALTIIEGCQLAMEDVHYLLRYDLSAICSTTHLLRTPNSIINLLLYTKFHIVSNAWIKSLLWDDISMNQDLYNESLPTSHS